MPAAGSRPPSGASGCRPWRRRWRCCAELGLGINVEIKPCPGREVETARVVVRDAAPALAGRPAGAADLELRARLPRRSRAIWHRRCPRGYLAASLPRRWREELTACDCRTLHLSDRRLRASQRAAVLAAGVPLLLYTVNDPARARDLLAAGVTSVFTDRVGEVLAALG